MLLYSVPVRTCMECYVKLWVYQSGGSLRNGTCAKESNLKGEKLQNHVIQFSFDIMFNLETMTSIFKCSKSCPVKEVNLILENAKAQYQNQGVEDLERQIRAQYQQDISDNQAYL